jgi:hypothetical protein
MIKKLNADHDKKSETERNPKDESVEFILTKN